MPPRLAKNRETSKFGAMRHDRFPCSGGIRAVHRLVNLQNPERIAASTWPTEARELSTLARLRRVIAMVPRGKVITYGEVAEAAGFPGAARLTVWALQAGDDLPWHRVVAAGGRIALPGTDGREQRLRLRVEGVTFRGGRVRMDRHAWRPKRRHRTARSVGRPPSARPAKGSRRPRANSRSRTDELFGFGPRPQPVGHRQHSSDPDRADDR